MAETAAPSNPPCWQLPYRAATACRAFAFVSARGAVVTQGCTRGIRFRRLSAHLATLRSSGVSENLLGVESETAIVTASSRRATALQILMEFADSTGFPVTTLEVLVDDIAAAASTAASSTSLPTPSSASPLISMASGCGRYWRAIADGNHKAAVRSLSFMLRDFRQALSDASEPWRGTNLGGWLLLEPGPASPFFEVCERNISEALVARGDRPLVATPQDEHGLALALDSVGRKQELFSKHRASHYDANTFARIRAAGLNAVRIPFGYWVVTGATCGEAFDGPCLDVLDRAVEMASSQDLQVLLDLHGNPGGENAERPCGRIDQSWRFYRWRFEESLAVLSLVAKRYCDNPCVTGLQICNEPSFMVPIEVLCSFYERAIEVVRAAGMPPSRVAVVIPAFSNHRLGEVFDDWSRRGNWLKYDNVAIDVHHYHEFSPVWSWLAHSDHLQVVHEHARELALLPGAVVGEWSLSRGGRQFSSGEQADYALAQVAAFNHATHGWFFWNWHDYEFFKSWDMERGVFGSATLPNPLTATDRDSLLRPDWKADPEKRVPSNTAWQLWPKVFACITYLAPKIWRVQSWLTHGRKRYDDCSKKGN
eukprot:TRINITY_DN63801_c0_g1_i1.p1 TRINITY_DN63801_c0_g1~~TRINITY_DN63801_c0_g1_i1.p1  ORF type:complete len:596 (-),score=88.70 TRINITY_DN63801_c0_g1_i1:439-2226(-)